MSLIGVKIGYNMSEIAPIGSSNTELNQQNDKEYNFAQIRKQLEQERLEKAQIRQELDEIKKIAQEKMYRPAMEEDEPDDEPYVDRRALKRNSIKLAEEIKTSTEQTVNDVVHKALTEERKQNWLKNNPDFVEVMGHAQKLQDKDPVLADIILKMPDNFERQQLVYQNIKAFNLHKKEEPKQSIQETIDRNRRGAFYQPPMMGAPPYAAAGDFSAGGQKNAYDQMQALKARLRLS